MRSATTTTNTKGTMVKAKPKNICKVCVRFTYDSAARATYSAFYSNYIRSPPEDV